ncbi:MAG: nucleotide triphosphate diphosphatase NUDT15 [Candidatus Aenigmatarchaeota archaeon]
MESEKIGVGVGVFLEKDGKVLLGRRHKDPEKADSELSGEGTWTLPGGGMKYKERPEETARREVKEETSIEVKEKDLKKVSVTDDRNGDVHFITIGFYCDEFEGEAKVMEPEEIVEWNWFELNDLPKPVFRPSEKLIEKVKKGERIL